MKKKLYFKEAFRRVGSNKAVLSAFCNFCSAPRLLLEVFIRKDFGERYFSLSEAMTIVVVLALVPLQSYTGDSWFPYLTWYAYLTGFFYMSLRHQQDLKRNPSVFDFKKYSLYTGKVNPVFFKVKIRGQKPDIRQVECLIEPAPFLIAGLVLLLIGQYLGLLLIVCSLLYGSSYSAAYAIGDHYVMDIIDGMIINEEMEKSFVDDADEDDTRSYRFRGQKPKDHDSRKKLLPLLNDEDEVLTAE